MRDALARWLAEHLEWRFDAADLTIHRIGSGHSRAMYVVAAVETSAVETSAVETSAVVDGGGPPGERTARRAVIRMEQGGVFGTSSAEECRVMSALHAVGFPVAEILGAEPTGAITGQPFFAMAYVEGDELTDERAVGAAASRQFVEQLDRLHRLDGRRFGFDLVPETPSDATPMQIERWRQIYRAASPEPIPLLDEAAAWLRHHAPPLSQLAVVHGDAGPGNFVHREGRLVAMTDFEFSHLGDPREDWSFVLAMRGARTLPRDEWLALFRDVAGVALSDDEWRYWEAFNLFKGACANRTCLDLFERGVNRLPNMAIIGTVLHQSFLRRLAAIIHG